MRPRLVKLVKRTARKQQEKAPTRSRKAATRSGGAIG
jgi:hypothetical protein